MNMPNDRDDKELCVAHVARKFEHYHRVVDIVCFKELGHEDAHQGTVYFDLDYQGTLSWV